MNDLKDMVWEKGEVVEGADSGLWRYDAAGAWIRYDEYGMTSAYGWVVEWMKPKSCGGTDAMGNLVPMHWRNHRYKGEDYPEYETRVVASGEKNVWKLRLWRGGELVEG